MTLVIDFKNYDIIDNGKIKVRLPNKEELILNEKDVYICPFTIDDMVMVGSKVGHIEELKFNRISDQYFVSFVDGSEGWFEADKIKRVKQ